MCDEEDTPRRTNPDPGATAARTLTRHAPQDAVPGTIGSPLFVARFAAGEPTPFGSLAAGGAVGPARGRCAAKAGPRALTQETPTSVDGGVSDPGFDWTSGVHS
jgi:hypothetical protein